MHAKRSRRSRTGAPGSGSAVLPLGRRFGAAALGVGLLLALAAAPARAETAAYPPVTSYPPIFGYNEIEKNGLGPFKKWAVVLERYAAERNHETDPCESGLFKRCDLQDWRKFLAEVQGKPLMEKLAEVNDYMNQHRYITDPVNWGVPDYWEVPREFFSKDGDCEDYAIAKYFSLRRLGVPPDMLRLVVLQDENLRVPHAILVVYVNGVAFVLDNQFGRVVDAGRISHYRPIYSVNENHWWLHARPRNRG
jgi:predicted transglutaminase-like cysteine proteinase